MLICKETHRTCDFPLDQHMPFLPATCVQNFTVNLNMTCKIILMSPYLNSIKLNV